PSAVGDVVIAQDFSRFIHGGDLLYKAATYTVASGTGRSQWQPATGINPVNAIPGQATCNQTVEFHAFTGGTAAYTEGVGMKDWGSSGNTSTRSGYIKMGGGGGGIGILYTALLSKLSGNANITVSFKAAVYSEGNNRYGEDVLVYVAEGALFGANGVITNASSVVKKGETVVDIADAIGEFKECSVTFTNVSPNSRSEERRVG